MPADRATDGVKQLFSLGGFDCLTFGQTFLNQLCRCRLASARNRNRAKAVARRQEYEPEEEKVTRVRRHRRPAGEIAGSRPNHVACSSRAGAGNGNRTRMASLEGWNFTLKLCPRARPKLASAHGIANFFCRAERQCLPSGNWERSNGS